MLGEIGCTEVHGAALKKSLRLLWLLANSHSLLACIDKTSLFENTQLLLLLLSSS